MEQLAAAQGLPRKFLESIVGDLRRAGLVRSRRGAGGGYLLTSSATEITVGDVIRVVDGPLAEVRGVRPHETDYDGDAVHLPVVWIAARAALRHVLDGTSLAQLQSGELPKVVRELAPEPGPGGRGDTRMTAAARSGDPTAYRIRSVRPDDAQAVLEAFGSAPDMTRQGDVTDLASAQRYVEWLRQSSRRSFAVCAGSGWSAWSRSASTRSPQRLGLLLDARGAAGPGSDRSRGGHSRGLGARARAGRRWPGAAGAGAPRQQPSLRAGGAGRRLRARGAGAGQFLIDGERIDVLTYGWLRSDPGPSAPHLFLEVEALT